jgi:hypothetical protein
MSTLDGARLDRMMEKIQQLLTLAERSKNDNEAALARSRAEVLMAKYRIEEAELADSHPELGITPGEAEWDLCTATTPYTTEYWTLMWYVAKHCGVRVTNRWNSDRRAYVVHAVGYESDLRYARMLYTSARTVFASRLEPMYDPELTEAENIYRMRAAGIERWRIAQNLWGSSKTDGPAHGRVARIYKKECERRGEDAALNGRQINAKTYRAAYAEGFCSEFYYRLSAARNAAESHAGALVLANRAESVDEAFYARYPHLRPADAGASTTAGASHKPRKLTKAERDREYRRHHSPSALRGRGVGAQAASEVEINATDRERRLDG